MTTFYTAASGSFSPSKGTYTGEGNITLTEVKYERNNIYWLFTLFEAKLHSPVPMFLHTGS